MASIAMAVGLWVVPLYLVAVELFGGAMPRELAVVAFRCSCR